MTIQPLEVEEEGISGIGYQSLEDGFFLGVLKTGMWKK
jgi:hypothetical protein